MKNIIIKIYFIGLILLSLSSCEDTGSLRYDANRAAINFYKFYSEYSYTKSMKNIDTIDIAFTINGLAKDYIRHADFEVLADSTTADDTEFTLLSAIVPADSLGGILEIEVIRPDNDTLPPRRIWIITKDGDDFITGVRSKQAHSLSLTNGIVYPDGWYPGSYMSRRYLGNYSTAYYKFIIEATGETAFPYPRAIPGYNGGKRWDYMFMPQFVNRIKDKLKAYNASIAPDVLTHDDGYAEGDPVVVGSYKKPE